MEYIRVRCSYCGGDGQYDPVSQLVQCPYCRQTQPYSPKGKSDVVAGSSNNLVVMANYALEVSDIPKALKYADKALEKDPKNYHAWLIRVKVLLREPYLSKDAIASIDNTVKYVPEQDKQSISREIADYINEITFLSAYSYRKEGESDANLFMRLPCEMKSYIKRRPFGCLPLQTDRYQIKRFEIAHRLVPFHAGTIIRLFYLYRLEVYLQTVSINRVVSSAEGIEEYNQYVDKHNNILDLITSVAGSSYEGIKFSRIETSRLAKRG